MPFIDLLLAMLFGTGMIKEELYRWLRLDRPTEESRSPFPPGYCHFPKYGEEFFKQLTAEQLVTRVIKGYRKPEWQKTRDRNEALDVRVYARAAAAVHGWIAFPKRPGRFSKRSWHVCCTRARTHHRLSLNSRAAGVFGIGLVPIGWEGVATIGLTPAATIGMDKPWEGRSFDLFRGTGADVTLTHTQHACRARMAAATKNVGLSSERRRSVVPCV